MTTPEVGAVPAVPEGPPPAAGGEVDDPSSSETEGLRLPPAATDPTEELAPPGGA